MKSNIFVKMLDVISEKKITSVNMADIVSSLTCFFCLKTCFSLFGLQFIEKLQFFLKCVLKMLLLPFNGQVFSLFQLDLEESIINLFFDGLGNWKRSEWFSRGLHWLIKLYKLHLKQLSITAVNYFFSWLFASQNHIAITCWCFYVCER